MSAPTPSSTIPRGHVACPCCGTATPVLRFWPSLRAITTCPSCRAPVVSMYALVAATNATILGVLSIVMLLTTVMEVNLWITLAVCIFSVAGVLQAMPIMPSRWLRQTPRELDRVQAFPIMTADQRAYALRFWTKNCNAADAVRITAWAASHPPAAQT